MLDNVINQRPTAVAWVVSRTVILIPNRVGNSGGLLAGLPRMAGAKMLGWGSTRVQFLSNWVVNLETLDALAAMLESSDIKVVIDKVYPLREAASAVARMLGHHASGNVVIAVAADGA